MIGDFLVGQYVQAKYSCMYTDILISIILLRIDFLHFQDQVHKPSMLFQSVLDWFYSAHRVHIIVLESK